MAPSTLEIPHTINGPNFFESTCPNPKNTLIHNHFHSDNIPPKQQHQVPKQLDAQKSPTTSGKVGYILNDTYYLAKVLGSGACGTVYYAKNLKNGQEVAIKTMIKPTPGYCMGIPISSKYDEINSTDLKNVYQSHQKHGNHTFDQRNIHASPINFSRHELERFQYHQIKTGSEECVKAVSSNKALLNEIILHSSVQNHPNILPIIEVLDSHYFLFVVLEYCPLGDLFGAITERNWYVGDDQCVKKMFIQLLDAVEYCHENGVYHCDLKPENIMVDKNGQVLKIADFGLASKNHICTVFGRGSSYYMAPETIPENLMYRQTSKKNETDYLDSSNEVLNVQNKADIEHRKRYHNQRRLKRPLQSKGYPRSASDVWALGVVLLNLTFGRNPWKKASLVEDPAYRDYSINPDTLRCFLPVSPELNQIMAQIFHPDPYKRIKIPKLREWISKCSQFTCPTNEFSWYKYSEGNHQNSNVNNNRTPDSDAIVKPVPTHRQVPAKAVVQINQVQQAQPVPSTFKVSQITKVQQHSEIIRESKFHFLHAPVQVPTPAFVQQPAPQPHIYCYKDPAAKWHNAVENAEILCVPNYFEKNNQNSVSNFGAGSDYWAAYHNPKVKHSTAVSNRLFESIPYEKNASVYILDPAQEISSNAPMEGLNNCNATQKLLKLKASHNVPRTFDASPNTLNQNFDQYEYQSLDLGDYKHLLPFTSDYTPKQNLEASSAVATSNKLSAKLKPEIKKASFINLPNAVNYPKDYKLSREGGNKQDLQRNKLHNAPKNNLLKMRNDYPNKNNACDYKSKAGANLALPKLPYYHINNQELAQPRSNFIFNDPNDIASIKGSGISVKVSEAKSKYSSASSRQKGTKVHKIRTPVSVEYQQNPNFSFPNPLHMSSKTTTPSNQAFSESPSATPNITVETTADNFSSTKTSLAADKAQSTTNESSCKNRKRKIGNEDSDFEENNSHSTCNSIRDVDLTLRSSNSTFMYFQNSKHEMLQLSSAQVPVFSSGLSSAYYSAYSSASDLANSLHNANEINEEIATANTATASASATTAIYCKMKKPYNTHDNQANSKSGGTSNNHGSSSSEGSFISSDSIGSLNSTNSLNSVNSIVSNVNTTSLVDNMLIPNDAIQTFADSGNKEKTDFNTASKLVEVTGLINHDVYQATAFAQPNGNAMTGDSQTSKYNNQETSNYSQYGYKRLRRKSFSLS